MEGEEMSRKEEKSFKPYKGSVSNAVKNSVFMSLARFKPYKGSVSNKVDELRKAIQAGGFKPYKGSVSNLIKTLAKSK